MVLPVGRRYRRRRFLVGGMTMLLVGGAAYKIGQSQAQQIQQHTGKPPEDLNQAELEQAMDDLGIDSQELTDQDKAAIEAEAVTETGGHAGARPAAGSTQPSYLDELQKLAELNQQGIITNEEFEAKKKQLLGL